LLLLALLLTLQLLLLLELLEKSDILLPHGTHLLHQPGRGRR
jgi:hypothetical protein